jgi:hypothetical protein
VAVAVGGSVVVLTRVGVLVLMRVVMRVGVLVPFAHVDPLPVRAGVDVPVP